MCKMKSISVVVFLFSLCVIGCRSVGNNEPSESFMEELRFWERRSASCYWEQDSIVYEAANVKYHFRKYMNPGMDTIVMYYTTAGDTVGLGGISLYDDELSSENDDYYRDFFDSIWIDTIKEYVFFIARARNGGTGSESRDNMYYIDTSRYALEVVKVVRAAFLYEDSIGLPDNQKIWQGERRVFGKDSIYSIFYIWSEHDPNCCPSVGKVTSRYDLEQLQDGRFVLKPKTFYFTPYKKEDEYW